MSCPDCVSGSVHGGTPQGTETNLGDISAYVVGDEGAARIIVIGVDVFGWRFVNTRLLADEYAAHGFRVVVPDLFSGAFLTPFRVFLCATSWQLADGTRSNGRAQAGSSRRGR